MRRFDARLITYGCLLVITGVFFVHNVNAQTYPNSFCFTMLGGKTCSDTGDSACQSELAPPNGTRCFWCASTNSLPNKTCGGAEGHTCTANGGECVTCGGLAMSGDCQAAECVNSTPQNGNNACNTNPYCPCN